MSHDGRDLACKLQYPDMLSAVEADLGQLKLIFSIYERYDRSISTREIHPEIAARLREELDYEREAKHTTLYRPDAEGRGQCAGAGGGAEALHQAPADHELALGRAAV